MRDAAAAASTGEEATRRGRDGMIMVMVMVMVVVVVVVVV